MQNVPHEDWQAIMHAIKEHAKEYTNIGPFANASFLTLTSLAGILARK